MVNDMRALSQLQVSILVRQRGSAGWTADVSTLPKAEAQMMAKEASSPQMGQAGATDLQIDGNQYRARVLPLARASNGQEAVAVLQRSVSEAVAPYQRLQLILLSITVLG
ncbi:cache domain-containing protein, partial [Acinetobacter baumannii]